MLWCILVAQKPLSSLLVDDYKACGRFMVAPAPAFRGLKASKTSRRWRPFAEQLLGAASQRQDMQILRAALE